MEYIANRENVGELTRDREPAGNGHRAIRSIPELEERNGPVSGEHQKLLFKSYVLLISFRVDAASVERKPAAPTAVVPGRTRRQYTREDREQHCFLEPFHSKPPCAVSG